MLFLVVLGVVNVVAYSGFWGGVVTVVVMFVFSRVGGWSGVVF